MALPATDAFTGTNGTQLETYSANWTINNGALDIQTNSLAPDSPATNSLAHWNADAFNADQYSQGTVVTQAGVVIGVAVRVHASAHTGYTLNVEAGNTTYFQKFVGGTETLFDSGTGVANSSVLRIEASGTTITPLDDGATPAGLVASQTDSAIASGSAGVSGYDDGTTTRLDNWEGGNLGGAPAATRRYSLTLTGVG